MSNLICVFPTHVWLCNPCSESWNACIPGFDNTEDFPEESARVKAIQGQGVKFTYDTYVLKVLLATYVPRWFSLDMARLGGGANGGGGGGGNIGGARIPPASDPFSVAPAYNNNAAAAYNPTIYPPPPPDGCCTIL